MKPTLGIVQKTLLLLVAVVLLNLLAATYHFRLDLTSDDRYTLSQATKDMLNELPEAVTVTAYFTEELPPELNMAREEFKDLLIEYGDRSNGLVVFDLVDPNQADSVEQEALGVGIRPILVNTRAKDKAEQLKVYMGAVVRMGSEQAVIPVIQPQSAMEWELSSRIKQVSAIDKPTVGILQGHGEPSVNMLAQVAAGLGVLYNVEPMAIYDTLPIHSRFNTILVVDPTDT
ncbi:MAG: GldG family protein, partial [Flavobacteriales bacterium]|nr:GldG family protein [Flavobacteriales bacterium]